MAQGPRGTKGRQSKSNPRSHGEHRERPRTPFSPAVLEPHRGVSSFHLPSPAPKLSPGAPGPGSLGSDCRRAAGAARSLLGSRDSRGAAGEQPGGGGGGAHPGGGGRGRSPARPAALEAPWEGPRAGGGRRRWAGQAPGGGEAAGEREGVTSRGWEGAGGEVEGAVPSRGRRPALRAVARCHALAPRPACSRSAEPCLLLCLPPRQVSQPEESERRLQGVSSLERPCEGSAGRKSAGPRRLGHAPTRPPLGPGRQRVARGGPSGRGCGLSASAGAPRAPSRRWSSSDLPTRRPVWGPFPPEGSRLRRQRSLHLAVQCRDCPTPNVPARVAHLNTAFSIEHAEVLCRFSSRLRSCAAKAGQQRRPPLAKEEGDLETTPCKVC